MARRQGAIAEHSGPADRRALKLNSPLVVRWEYASEERQAQRDAIYRQLVEGDNAEDVAFAAVAEARPQTLLDAGAGAGDFAERVERELGVEVIAVDISARMVSLAKERGVDAQVADVQALPFADGSFDVVSANWVLYHVEDLERGIAELARVLRPGGLLVAATQGRGHLMDLWRLLGDPWDPDLSFDDVNGEAALQPHFASVELRRGDGVIVFRDPHAMRDFVAATITHSYLAGSVPALDEPFRARTVHGVFLARKRQ